MGLADENESVNTTEGSAKQQGVNSATLYTS